MLLALNTKSAFTATAHLFTRKNNCKFILKKELKTVKSIKVPIINEVIKGEELYELIIDNLKPEEIIQFVDSIQIIKKRNERVECYLQVFALGLIKKYY